MRRWSDFYPLVLPSVTGAFEGAVDVALRQAAIEFCCDTHVLKRTLDAVRTRAGTAVYDLELDRDEALVRLLKLTVGGKSAGLITAQAADDQPDDEARTDLVAYTVDRATIVLDPVPTVAGLPILVRAAVKPSQDAEGVADELFEHHARAIADGAIRELCQQPARSYFNAALAGAKAQAFERAKRDAIAAASAGHARVRLRVKSH